MVWIVVIVVVLAISIPVVLAAFLYVMVSPVIMPGPGSSKPVLAFATPTPTGSGWQIPVASASQAMSPTNFKLNLVINGIFGAAITMPLLGGGSVLLTVGSSFFRVEWNDIGGERTLNGGDSFLLTQTDASGTSTLPFPGASSVTFYLLWSDGSQISAVSFQTL